MRGETSRRGVGKSYDEAVEGPRKWQDREFFCISQTEYPAAAEPHWGICHDGVVSGVRWPRPRASPG